MTRPKPDYNRAFYRIGVLWGIVLLLSIWLLEGKGPWDFYIFIFIALPVNIILLLLLITYLYEEALVYIWC
ncbi:MAG: hypothetical protein HRT67_03310 [Flavobacteriaceae bacterium]|nr:hypothetical protein [Flavobacteriaceae bacterium]